MGNDKYISFEGTPKVCELWTRDEICNVAHATAVALDVKPTGLFSLEGEPPYALGIVYTSSIYGTDLIDWLKQNMRHGRIDFRDSQMPTLGYFYRNSEQDEWEWTDLEVAAAAMARLRAKSQTPERRREVASKAGRAWWESLNVEERAARVEKLRVARRKQAKQVKQRKASESTRGIK